MARLPVGEWTPIGCNVMTYQVFLSRIQKVVIPFAKLENQFFLARTIGPDSSFQSRGKPVTFFFFFSLACRNRNFFSLSLFFCWEVAPEVRNWFRVCYVRFHLFHRLELPSCFKASNPDFMMGFPNLWIWILVGNKMTERVKPRQTNQKLTHDWSWWHFKCCSNWPHIWEI